MVSSTKNSTTGSASTTKATKQVLTTTASAFLVALLAVSVAAYQSSSSTSVVSSSNGNFIFNKHILTWGRTKKEPMRMLVMPSMSTQTLPRKETTLFLPSWLRDALNKLGMNFETETQTFQQEQRNKPNPNNNDEHKKRKSKGKVMRTAYKPFNAQASTPASPLYTTRKESSTQITLNEKGVENDYNHYRTVALKSTSDRAVSILTTDILQKLKVDQGYTNVQVGDLGENIYIDEIDYKFFEIGKQYRFSTGTTENGEEGGSSILKKAGEKEQEEGVIIQITERIEPCGNLCKLPYINDEKLPPPQRLEKCKRFLLYLDQKDGLRGWYGKIIQGGIVKVGDEVSALAVAV